MPSARAEPQLVPLSDQIVDLADDGLFVVMDRPGRGDRQVFTKEFRQVLDLSSIAARS